MADSNKTEQATPQHRLKARKQGQVTRSRELTSAACLFAVAGVCGYMAREGASHWAGFFRISLEAANSDAFSASGPILFWTSVEAMRWVVPIMLCALVASVGGGLAQGGFVFAPESLAPKIDRLSPVSKMKQLFSPMGLSNALKSLIPFTAIGWIGYAGIRSHWGQILHSSYANPRVFATLVGTMAWDVCWKSGMVLLGWAAVDYFLLWTKAEGDMKMSRQDIRDEMKDTEGNPASKMRIRKLQRQARRKQMIKAAETATVVITNPTHYAVALKFEASMPAPIVVAKGLDLLAQKIKEIARDKDIPIMENRPLAQALYKSVEVGDMIPSALYHAVAEILVLVYKVQKEMKERDARRRAANPWGEMRF
jgi:flagellar biosynthetic protein FlhB